jgi:hypothetical protein
MCYIPALHAQVGSAFFSTADFPTCWHESNKCASVSVCLVTSVLSLKDSAGAATAIQSRVESKTNCGHPNHQRHGGDGLTHNIVVQALTRCASTATLL